MRAEGIGDQAQVSALPADNVSAQRRNSTAASGSNIQSVCMKKHRNTSKHRLHHPALNRYLHGKRIYLLLEQRERLKARLRETLAGRLRLALNNATGYTLDDLDDEDDEDSDGSLGETQASPPRASPPL